MIIRAPQTQTECNASGNGSRDNPFSEGFHLPSFRKPGHGKKDAIPTMPGQYQFSVDTIVQEAKEVWDLGIPSVILFGFLTGRMPWEQVLRGRRRRAVGGCRDQGKGAATWW